MGVGGSLSETHCVFGVEMIIKHYTYGVLGSRGT